MATSDWLSVVPGSLVGLAGLCFGWITSKQSREQTERLAAQANEHARLLAEQSSAHIRQLEQERRTHEARLAAEERRLQQVKDVYVQIMTTVRLVGEELSSTKWSANSELFDPGDGLAAYAADLARASALADVFASDEVLHIFNGWREMVAEANQAAQRIMAQKKDVADDVKSQNILFWKRQLKDKLVGSTDARHALAAAIADELGARRRDSGDYEAAQTRA